MFDHPKFPKYENSKDIDRIAKKLKYLNISTTTQIRLKEIIDNFRVGTVPKDYIYDINSPTVILVDDNNEEITESICKLLDLSIVEGISEIKLNYTISKNSSIFDFNIQEILDSKLLTFIIILSIIMLILIFVFLFIYIEDILLIFVFFAVSLFFIQGLYNSVFNEGNNRKHMEENISKFKNSFTRFSDKFYKRLGTKSRKEINLDFYKGDHNIFVVKKGKKNIYDNYNVIDITFETDKNDEEISDSESDDEVVV
jgi:hypothetical protein